jgi:PAT family beta-lactamase induction signal transducer AmpG
VDWAGWPAFFIMTILIAVPGLALLWWMRGMISGLDVNG